MAPIQPHSTPAQVLFGEMLKNFGPPINRREIAKSIRRDHNTDDPCTNKIPKYF